METRVSITNCTWDGWMHWLSKALLLIHWHIHTYEHKSNCGLLIFLTTKTILYIFLSFSKRRICDIWATNSVYNCETSTRLLTWPCWLSVLTLWGLTKYEPDQPEKYSRILSFILTRKGSSFKKDCFTNKAYKMYIRNTDCLSNITISGKMLKEFLTHFFKGRECLTQSFLLYKLILLQSKKHSLEARWYYETASSKS